MTDEAFAAIDAYLIDHLGGDDGVLAATLARSSAAGLPPIAVSALQGKFLYLMATLIGARRILEIGTLGGYSALWLARGLLAGGRLDTIEIDPAHADVAAESFTAARLDKRITLHRGAALDILPTLDPGYDLVFIDADKENNTAYFDTAVRLARPGALIVVDNIVRRGEILTHPDDPKVIGTRALFDAVKDDHRVDTGALQLVGAKGWDGMLLARKL